MAKLAPPRKKYAGGYLKGVCTTSTGWDKEAKTEGMYKNDEVQRTDGCMHNRYPLIKWCAAMIF